ncbi:MAG: iron complex outerrane recepter protein [Sphingomonadales bacterium]|jgi:TonB-dependent receptor|nr:iron complex outerrane recepter protein [Sphingomonadales bacterium]
MRVKTLVLGSASLTIIALAGSPAFAQGNPANGQPTPVGAAPPSTASNVPAGPAADAATDDTIVVTGLRRSLQSAENIKRNAPQQIDAIVAEDIGKLPDVAVSDTAARIPGIQVLRERGEAGRVLLRGLDETFYTTTYNGREIFTAERRSVALQDFPAGGISAIEAFKTSTANLVEPGLSGLVNVRSRRPFDFRGAQIAGSVWANYPRQSEKVSPNAQLLISDRWDTGAGEFGALINFSYTRLHYQDSIRRHGFFIADLAGGRSPDWPEIHYNQADRWRPSINGALQWRPQPGLEFYAEGLWQGYREHVTDNMWAQPLWGGGSYTNIVKDGNNIVSGTVNTPTGCCGPNTTWGFQGATKRKTDTYQFAVGGSYDAGSLHITADLARTQSTFNLRTESVDYEINTNNYSVDWYTGPVGGYGPTFQVHGIDPANPAIYNYRGFFEDYLTAKGKDWQARLDFEWKPGVDFLRNIQWGVRYVDRDASAHAGAFYWNAGGRGVPITAVPLDYELFHSAFRGDAHKPAPLTWLAPTFDSVWNNLTQLRQFNINLLHTGSVTGPPVDPGRTFGVNEKSYAGYAQANYEFDLGGGASIDGAIGIRAVKTKESINGTQFTATGPQPINFRNEYTDWLPNANMRIRFTPELMLRLAATKTRTRPTFQQLNPAISFGPPPSCTPAQPSCARIGSGGNPFLTPLKTNNYDASLEYYFSRTGFVAAAVFRRDMTGFIVNQAYQYPTPDAATGLPIIITGPVNTRKARIQGVEAQLSTFFDFAGVPDWLKRFGVQANATYIDAKADFTLFCAPDRLGCQRASLGGDPYTNATTRRLLIPDVSKWTYNLVGMYEGGGLTLRLAYNVRTGYPEGDLSQRDTRAGTGQTSYTLQGRGHKTSRLDWSSSYAFNEHLTIFFDWTNILGKPFKSDIVRVNYVGGNVTSTEAFPMVVRYEESVLTGGVRFRF